MNNRFRFSELKELKLGDEFWTRSKKFKVTTEPIINKLKFYGDEHEKLEWDGYSEDDMREMHFAVADNEDPFTDEEFNIYKSPTSNNIEGSSPLQPREDTETTGKITIEEVKSYAEMKKDGEIPYSDEGEITL